MKSVYNEHKQFCTFFLLIRNGNKFLEAENEMFEHFLNRVVPSDELRLPAEPVDTGSHGGSRGENVFRGRRSRGTSARVTDKLLTLSLPQKCNIALKEIQIHRDEMAKCEGEFERAFDGYQVSKLWKTDADKVIE